MVTRTRCEAAIEFLFIFVKNSLYKEVSRMISRIKDTPDMLNLIYNNRNIITNNSISWCFDVVSMFPIIHNILGLEAIFWNST